ncbi:MAG: oligosaccharide flippase family protein [Moraxellaceae bacterium]
MSDRRVAVWTIASTIVSALLQLLLMMVAARHMGLASFGLLAVINTISAVLLTFQEMGLSSYCIYIGEQSHRQHATLFWVSAGLAGIFALILLIVSPLIAFFFRMEALSSYIYVLSANFILVGFSAQFQANFIRVMRADMVAKAELLARVFSFGLAVSLMVLGTDGVVAIVVGMTVFSLVKLLVMALFSEPQWRPSLAFDRAVAKQALRYGGYQGGSQLVNQLRSRIDIVLIGRLLGPEMVGLYSMAKDLLEYPLRVFQPLMGRLLLPRLARLRDKPELLHVYYFRGLTFTAFGALVVYGLMILLGPWVVEILYGRSFSEVATLLPAFLVYATLRPLGINAGLLAQATGQTGREFSWNLLSICLMAAGMALTALLASSVSGFAIGLSVIQLLVSVLVFPLFVQYFLPVSLRAYIQAWIGAAVAALALALLASQIYLPPLHSLIDWGGVAGVVK